MPGKTCQTAQVEDPNLIAAATETPRSERAHAIVAHVADGHGGAQVQRLAGLAMKRKPSVDFSGYWQRHEMKEAAN
jgi:serine/threonine protein phosphatase PrpC